MVGVPGGLQCARTRNRSEEMTTRIDFDDDTYDEEIEEFLRCFRCDHPNAKKARREITSILVAINHGWPIPPQPDIEGLLPANCCKRKPRLVSGASVAQTSAPTRREKQPFCGAFLPATVPQHA